jgi:hypothetical protein
MPTSVVGVRRARAPDATVLAFFQTTYDAAADRGALSPETVHGYRDRTEPASADAAR